MTQLQALPVADADTGKSGTNAAESGAGTILGVSVASGLAEG
jgi:hypothetical protein